MDVTTQYPGVKMRNWINLFDLDDTIINSKHRSKFEEDGSLNIPHWNENGTLCNILKDNLIFNMTNVLQYFTTRDDFWNVAITSRELGDADFIFFMEHNIKFDDTLHRGSSHLGADYCNRYKLADFELKDVLLTNYNAEYKRGFAFDDKQCNLDVFKKHGYHTYDANHINRNEIKYSDVIESAKSKLFK
jgi:hypothetical protein